MQKNIAKIIAKSSNTPNSYAQYITDLSLTTGINAEKIYLFTHHHDEIKDKEKYDFSLDEYGSYFTNIGIEMHKIVTYNEMSLKHAIDTYYFIYKNILLFEEIDEIKDLMDVNIKRILSDPLKNYTNSPFPTNDENLISLILYFKPTWEEARAYYLLASKAPIRIFDRVIRKRKITTPKDKLDFTADKMYSFALIRPDYFDSIEEWMEAFSYCRNYRIEISDHT